MKIKNRMQFVRKFESIYMWILRNKPRLLDSVFPIRDTVSETKKILENKYYKKGSVPIYPSTLAAKHSAYHNPKTKQYKKEWSIEMKKKYPILSVSVINRSYKKMIKLMPKNIKFKSGQTWKGVSHKYIFIDDEYGEFEACPENLLYRSWKKGSTGHPKRKAAYLSQLYSKKIKCSNGKIYESVKSAARELNTYRNGINNVLRGKTSQHKGYTFSYIEEKMP